MKEQNCPFCFINPERVAFTAIHGDGIWDAFPVNPGHMLIVPRRHVSTWHDLTERRRGRGPQLTRRSRPFELTIRLTVSILASTSDPRVDRQSSISTST